MKQQEVALSAVGPYLSQETKGVASGKALSSTDPAQAPPLCILCSAGKKLRLRVHPPSLLDTPHPGTTVPIPIAHAKDGPQPPL